MPVLYQEVVSCVRRGNLDGKKEKPSLAIIVWLVEVFVFVQLKKQVKGEIKCLRKNGFGL